MNWARGLKFAGIHVAIAILLITSEEMPRWSMEKSHSLIHINGTVLAAYQEEGGTVEFTPICENWRAGSSVAKLFSASETPALILSGWASDCPPSWTISGMFGIDMKHRSRAQELAADTGLCVLIAIQWILLGALPLIKPRRWWLEPGAGNTVLTVIGTPIVFISKWLESADVTRGQTLLIAFGVLVGVGFLVILSTWLAWIGLIAQRLLFVGWETAKAALHSARTR